MEIFPLSPTRVIISPLLYLFHTILFSFSLNFQIIVVPSLNVLLGLRKQFQMTILFWKIHSGEICLLVLIVVDMKIQRSSSYLSRRLISGFIKLSCLLHFLWQYTLACCLLRCAKYNVLDYDEKVVDGFFDVFRISIDPTIQGKMPSIADLKQTQVILDLRLW